MVPVFENYTSYKPPAWVRGTIVKLLSRTPANYLSGIQSVVLTDSAAIGAGKTHRIQGRKHVRKECLGWYHAARKGEQAWIQIVVDNIISSNIQAGMPRYLLRIPPFRKSLFGQTLFHEIGHHLDLTIGAPAPTGEQAADAWRDRLLARYVRRQYWYAVPLLRFVVAPLLRLIMRRHERKSPARPKKSGLARIRPAAR
jgi:hypothetical protein